MFSDLWLVRNILKKRLPDHKRCYKASSDKLVINVGNDNLIVFDFHPSSGNLIDIYITKQKEDTNNAEDEVPSSQDQDAQRTGHGDG